MALIIGLTGGIGAGKSTASAFFARVACPSSTRTAFPAP